jgi:Capsule polysaccharide biosynthesis protein
MREIVMDGGRMLGDLKQKMKTVLLLSRGVRLSAVFGALARELSTKHRVIVVFRAPTPSTADNPKDWAGIANLISYDLGTEIRARATGDLHKRAVQIEQQIGLNLYSSASNYLLYRRFAKDYFKSWTGLYDTEHEILEEFVGSHALISDIFDRHRPDLVFCETPDIVSHRVAQAVAYRRGVFTLGSAFNNLYGDGIVNFTFGCNRRNPWLEYFYRHQDEISAESWEAAGALMARLAAGQLHDAKYVKHYKHSIERSAVITNLSRAGEQLRSSMPISDRYAQLKRTASISRNRRWLNRHLQRSLPTQPYMLVSLHYQPEASTCMVAPRWVDQDYVVEQAAINAPYGIRIAVKENPKKFGLRGKAYYSRLVDLTNVDLIHPLVSNDLLIRNATVVLSIAGTVGMEAIALGKKVAILGRASYDVYEGAKKINHPAEIFEHLADPAWNPDVLVDQRRAFLAAIAQSTFYLGHPQTGTSWPRAESAGPNYARALDRFLTFIDRTNFPVDRVCASL